MSRKGNRKTRKRQRDRSFDRRRGRKLGPVPLRKSAMRYEVAVFALLTQEGGRLHDSPIHAAEFAASVFNKSVTVSAIENGLSFEYRGGRGERVVTMTGQSGKRIEHDPELRDD